MVLTQSQISDVKLIIQETIKELFTDKTFMEGIAVKVKEALNLPELDKRSKHCEDQITEVKEINRTLQSKMESLERFSRRNNLRIYGIREKENEDIVDTLKRETKLEFLKENIEYAYRMGKTTADGCRAIFVRFTQQKYKLEIINNRKNLRGTKIIIADDLTKRTHEILKEAVAKLGKKNVWCMNGKIWYRNGPAKHCIDSEGDISRYAT